MANQIIIDIGAAANDGTGDPLRTAFDYVNDNFSNVWATGLPESNVTFDGNRILTVNTNGNLVLSPNGVGVVESNVSIVPNLNRAHNLGSSDHRWDTLYVWYMNANNMAITGNLSVGGNLYVTGNIIETGNIVTDTLTIQLANTAVTDAQANGAGITVGADDDIATLLYDSANNVWTTNIGISVGGPITGTSVAVSTATIYGNLNGVDAYFTGNVTANSFIGDGSQLTNINANSIDGLANVAYTGDYNDLINTPDFGNLTIDITTTGNITGNYIIGNGSTLSSILGSNVTGNVANAVYAESAGIAGTATSVPAGNVTGLATVATSGSYNDLSNVPTNVSSFTNDVGYITANIASNLTMNSQWITDLSDPVNLQDAATKSYVDAVAQGLHLHNSCNVATTQDLAVYTGATVTYNNGTAGVGATLTFSGNTLTTIDGFGLTAQDRILVKNEANAVFNGIYIYSNNTSLVRSTDFDTDAEAAGGDFVFVTSGSINADTGWVQTTDFVSIGNSNIVWQQFSAAGSYTANTSAGLFLNGSQFNAQVDNVTTAFDLNGNIAVKAGAALTTPNIDAATGTSLSLTGNITSNYVFGNGSQLTGFTSSQITTALGYTPGTGNGTVTNVQGDGTVSGLSLTGNVSTAGNLTLSGTLDLSSVSGNISTTGNITGNYVLGNAAYMTGIPAQYDDPNVATFLAAFGSNTINTTGNITSGDILLGNTVVANISSQSAPIWITSANTQYVSLNSNNYSELYWTSNLENLNPDSGNDDYAWVFVHQDGVFIETNPQSGDQHQWTFRANGVIDSNYEMNIAANVTVTGNISGNYILGNGSQLTGLPATYGDSNVVTLLSGFGSNTISTTGNITGGNITGTGTVSGNVLTSTNSSGPEGGEIQLALAATGTTLSNGVTIDVYQNQLRIFESGGTNRGAYIDLTAAATSVGSNLLAGGSGSYGDSNVVTLLTSYGSNTISTTGNVTSGYFLGNGSQLTGVANLSFSTISANGTSVVADSTTDTLTLTPGNNLVITGNATSDTVTFAVSDSPTFSGNVTGGNILTSGQVSAAGNVTGNYILGNGALLTGVVSSYGNSNVATFLAAYGSNTISTTGNITAGNITDTGSITVTGNITGGNLSVTGNITGNTNGFAIGYLNIPQIVFSANATTALTDAGKHYYSTSASNLTLTIANNTSVGFAVGTAINLINLGTGNVTVAADTGVTLYFAGNSVAGNRTISSYGAGTIQKVATDTWFLVGVGVT